MPELFAKNTKYLIHTFNLTQADIAAAIGADQGAFSRYLNGSKDGRKALPDNKYILAADYLLLAICTNKENTKTLCRMAGLEEINDYPRFSKEKDFRKETAEILLPKLKDKDLSIEDPEQNKRRRLPGRRFLFITTTIILVTFIGLLLYNSTKPKVVLEITEVSPIDDPSSFISGNVITNGNFSPDDFAVTVAIVSPQDGRIYGPKPSAEVPTVPVTLTDRNGVGNFICVFANGFTDADAEELYVYVVPKDFWPDVDLEATKNASVASLKYSRKKN